MTGQTYFIGEAANKSRTTVIAIRYYEKTGLIPEAPRSGKYRLYSDQMIERIQFIKKSQALGFSLQEIKDILSVYDLGEATCCEVEESIEQKLPLIEQKIRELQALRRELLDLKRQLSTQDQRDSSKICPVIHNKV